LTLTLVLAFAVVLADEFAIAFAFALVHALAALLALRGLIASSGRRLGRRSGRSWCGSFGGCSRLGPRSRWLGVRTAARYGTQQPSGGGRSNGFSEMDLHGLCSPSTRMGFENYASGVSERSRVAGSQRLRRQFASCPFPAGFRLFHLTPASGVAGFTQVLHFMRRHIFETSLCFFFEPTAARKGS
jgi:hypothetical protein